MKKTFRALALIGGVSVALFALPWAGHSQNFYFNANAGASLADDVDLRQFVVPTRGGELELDPGPRLSVAGGYSFNDFIGVQVETGFIYNEIKNVNSRGDDEASLSHVPLLADVVLRYDKPDCKWVPYIGAGAGGDASVIMLDHVRAPNGTVVDGSGSELVFAWQAFAGARYKITDQMSIGGGYKFYSASGASWDVRNTAGDIKAGTARVHSLGVDFTMKF
ncbi:MAG TPA: outer membrane beta-barrel protein [Candidatus Acidoferrum sp.]|nr:outer membrane beta-barrel protein [Candidatus Acidoferrum sp.]